MAGQGTVGLEIMEKLPEADVVFVPIGGGGLISGVACAIKSINPNCKVYGVQAAGAPSMKQSIEHKKIEKLASVSTMADGIAVKEPGTLTFEACMKYVDGIVTVTEAEIASAILMLRLSYPADVKIIRVPCSCRVNPMFILRAFEKGADGVIMCGCHPGDCHYSTGNYYARRRMTLLFSMLDYIGVENGRTRVEWVSAAEGVKFSQTMNEFVEKIHSLGKNVRLEDLRCRS